MNGELNRVLDDVKEESYPHLKKRKFAKSPLTPDFSPTMNEDKKPNDEFPASSSCHDHFGLNPDRPDGEKQSQADASSSTPDSPSHRLLHPHLGQHPFFNQPYHYLKHAGLTNQAASVSSTSIPKFPHLHQGPQPITPPPPAPQISAAELSLLTEVSATKNGTFQCTLCHKQFGYKNGLIRHVRLTHVGEKPYQCNICNRRFGYKHILMEHQNLHFGNRPYACVQCDKRFAARSNLIQHRTVHKRPYNCTLCNKRFDREDQLKKHLFAHPQSLLACSACEYTANSQADMNRHLAESHRPVLSGESPYSQHYNNAPTDEDFAETSRRQNTSTSSDVHNNLSRARAADQDATASRVPPFTSDQSGRPNEGLDMQNVVIKKEIVDSSDAVNQPEAPHPPYGFDQSAGFHPHGSASKYGGEWMDMKQAFQKTIMAGLDNNRSNFDKEMFGNWMPQNSLPQQSQIQFSHHQQQSSLVNQNQRCQNFSDDKPMQSMPSALPGIHEVFSKKNQTSLPSFSHFIPNSTKSGARNSQLHHQQQTQMPPPSHYISTQNHHQDHFTSGPPSKHQSNLQSSATTSNIQLTSSSQPPNPPSGFQQRPTAQLPPIAHPPTRQTKDQAVQHSVAISGFPSLDEVLSYYVGQGRLFKCQHCNILFFERGMFFLHASLHAFTNPWQCSICHKVCSDKNEFTLHFVNQQHNS